MFFSEYIVLEREPSSVDPLGYLRPASALTDGLFKQFTVLTNHPCYQGLLCCLLEHLEAKGVVAGSKEYSYKFRELESLWGILNAQAKVSVVNTTKYALMIQDPSMCTLGSAGGVGLFARPAYGTLGHYTSPSASWGLLDRRGLVLTEIGRRLGNAWRDRSGLRFTDHLEAWTANKAFDLTSHQELVDAFQLHALPAPAEAEVWRELIHCYGLSHGEVRPLWDRPLGDDLLALADAESPQEYAGFFAQVEEVYQDSSILLERLETARQFETLAALCSQVFEWEYVRRLEEAKGNLPDLGKVEVALGTALRSGANEYLKRVSARDARSLFRQLTCVESYAAAAAVVIGHHGEHQRSKGAGVYLDKDNLLVGGRYPLAEVVESMQSLRDSDVSVQVLTRGRRRNWHFGRCRDWCDYATGSVEV